MAVATALAALFEHNLWANLLVLDKCATLNDEQLDATAPGVYGSIRSTLVHIFGAEERYITTLTNAPPVPFLREDVPFPGFDELRKVCEQSGRSLIEIADHARPDEILVGRRRNGQTYKIAATVLLTQAINHATEHRSHINTILTQLGIEPVEIDGWAYADAHNLIWMNPPPTPAAS
jgi:uncharacterized damage-inducible protein DinB